MFKTIQLTMLVTLAGEASVMVPPGEGVLCVISMYAPLHCTKTVTLALRDGITLTCYWATAAFHLHPGLQGV